MRSNVSLTGSASVDSAAAEAYTGVIRDTSPADVIRDTSPEGSALPLAEQEASNLSVG